MIDVNYVYAIERNASWEIDENYGLIHPDREVIAQRIAADKDNELAWCNVQLIASCRLFEAKSRWLNFRSYDSRAAFEESTDYKKLKKQARDNMIAILKECADLYQVLSAQSDEK